MGGDAMIRRFSLLHVLLPLAVGAAAFGGTPLRPAEQLEVRDILQAPRAPRSTSWTSASSVTSERRRPKQTCIAAGRGPRFRLCSATAQQLWAAYAQHETCACWRDAARPRLTSSRADRGLAGRDLCATRGGAVELDAVDPYARGVLARARRPGAATSCAKLVRRRRDFWVKLLRARRARSTERRAMAAPVAMLDGLALGTSV